MKIQKEVDDSLKKKKDVQVNKKKIVVEKSTAKVNDNFISLIIVILTDL